MKKKRIIPILCPDTGMGAVGLDLIESDPMGSYTGLPEDPLETPVQDADDL